MSNFLPLNLVNSFPFKMILPLVGLSRQPNKFKSVDFPLPLFPTKNTKPFDGSFKEIVQ